MEIIVLLFPEYEILELSTEWSCENNTEIG